MRGYFTTLIHNGVPTSYVVNEAFFDLQRFKWWAKLNKEWVKFELVKTSCGFGILIHNGGRGLTTSCVVTKDFSYLHRYRRWALITIGMIFPYFLLRGISF